MDDALVTAVVGGHPAPAPGRGDRLSDRGLAFAAWAVLSEARRLLTGIAQQTVTAIEERAPS